MNIFLGLLETVLKEGLIYGIMAMGVYAISKFNLNYSLILSLGIVAGLILYLIPAWLFKMNSMKYIFELLQARKEK